MPKRLISGWISSVEPFLNYHMPKTPLRCDKRGVSCSKRHVQLPPALVSIHDVMPQTMTEVKKILHVLEGLSICPVTLLVVSGLEWSERELCLLRAFQKTGYELAGHGWNHQCFRPETCRHKIHSVIISRNTAEHLSLKSSQIVEVIQHCFQWFQDVDLQPPTLYVPPAWAIGQIPRDTLNALPFRLYEGLTGIYDVRTGHSFRLPLVGYMADTRLRIWLLRILNDINRRLSVSFGLPLRIAIHPHDLQLGLVSDLKTVLKQYTGFISYTDLMYKKGGKKAFHHV